MTDCCSNCRYSETKQKLIVGDTDVTCRRNPPITFPVPGPRGVSLMTSWPIVKASAWCGAHEPPIVRMVPEGEYDMTPITKVEDGHNGGAV